MPRYTETRAGEEGVWEMGVGLSVECECENILKLLAERHEREVKKTGLKIKFVSR